MMFRDLYKMIDELHTATQGYRFEEIRLRLGWVDFKAKLGALLLPVLTKFLEGKG